VAIPFARTTRSLEADSFRAAYAGWIVAAVLLACWAWWFFRAEVKPVDNAGAPSTPAALVRRAIGGSGGASRR
jgi:hypothetical protein